MTVNTSLLRLTLAHIENNQQAWDQTAWAIRQYRDGETCGTAYCFAGWAVQLAGHSIQFDDSYTPIPEGPDHQHGLATLRGTDQLEPIDTLAQHELGLNTDQAKQLFAENNRLTDLRRIVDQLIAETA